MFAGVGVAAGNHRGVAYQPAQKLHVFVERLLLAQLLLV
jgi:hypothetical protein